MILYVSLYKGTISGEMERSSAERISREVSVRGSRQVNEDRSNLLTVAQVAAELRVTDETVRRYIRERKLKAEKRRTVGLKKVWMVTKAEVVRFAKT